MLKNQPATKKQLRTFGIALSILLAIIGLINFLKGNVTHYQWLWSAAILVFLITIIVPIVIKPVYRAAIFFAHVLGWINTRLILGIIYYLMFTPISLVFKIIKKDLLDRKFDNQAKTYWNTNFQKIVNKEQYLKQF